MSANRILSVRLGPEDSWRLAELTAMLGTNPSDVVRQLLCAAIPLADRRYAELPDYTGDDEPTLPPTDERDTLPPGVDPRQLDMYEHRGR